MVKKSLLILSLVWVCSCSTTLQVALEKCQSLHKNGDFNGALTCFSEIAQNEPNNFSAYKGMGLAHRKLDNRDEAIQYLSKAISLNSEDAQAYIVRGVLFEEQGSFDKAIGDYGKALQIEKDQSKITSLFGMRAAAYAQSKNYSRAVEDFTNAISRGDKESDTFDLRGFSYAMLGDSDRAIADYIQAISANPDNAEAYAHLGNEYAKKEDYNKAIAEYDKAIKLVPDDASYYFNRGLAYAKKKDFDLAIRDLEQALTFNPNFGIAKELLERVKTSELLHERLDFSTQPQVTQ